MARLCWLCLCLCLTSTVRAAVSDPPIEPLFIATGESANLTVAGSCPAGKKFLLVNEDRTVSSYEDGQWIPDAAYAPRLQHVSESSVMLTRVNSNDDGLFEFLCGDSLVNGFQVRVVLPWNVSGSVGQRVVLPCHLRTVRSTAELLQWRKNGVVELELDLLSRKTTTKMSPRFSVSPDCKDTGDCSLIIEGAQGGDMGDYICSLGMLPPTAVRMKIDTVARPLIATTGAPAVANNQTQEASGKCVIPTLVLTTFLTNIAVNVLFISFAALCCYLWHKCRSNKSDEANRTSFLYSVLARRV